MGEPGQWMVWLILLPLAWGSLAFLSGPARGAWLALPTLLLQLWLALQLSGALPEGGVLNHAVGGWGAPLGIELAADGLSLLLLLLTQLVALPLAVYASAYFDSNSVERRYFWPLFGFLLAGLNGLFLSADLFNVYVTLELIGLAAVGLVGSGGGAQQISAALRYLFANLVGSGAYLLGVALLYGSYGTVSSALIEPLITSDAPRLVGLAGGLMLTGLLLKTALFPFHYWLPPAHGSAPAPMSALLSGLVVKAPFYLILRLWLGPFADLSTLAESLGWLLMALGAAAIIWGSWRAVRASRIKMLVAYSTVAQLGYLFLIFPLLGVVSALQAGVMQLIAHGLAKSAMFLAAGVLIKATGQERVDGLAGAVGHRPLTMFAFGLAGVTLMGLPPSAGFLAKWLLIDAALDQGYWYIAFLVLAGGLMAAVYVFRVLRQAFLLAPPAQEVMPVPRILEWMAFLLAALSVLLGLRGVEVLKLLSAGATP